MEEIRLGTIGSGVIVHTILENVARTDGIRLVAVYSRKEDTGRALASEYGAKRIYTDMNAADETVNFVYVATPNLLHYEQVKKALPKCSMNSLIRSVGTMKCRACQGGCWKMIMIRSILSWISC